VTLFIVSDCLGWPEILLVATQLSVAVFDKCSFTRVEDCTLIIRAIISNVALTLNVYFLIDIWHLLLKIPLIGTNVNLVTLTCLMFVCEEVARLCHWLTIVWVTRVNNFGVLVRIAEGSCRRHLEHTMFQTMFLPIKRRKQIVSALEH